MLYTLGGVEEGRIYSISKTCSKKTIVPIIITPQKVPKIKQHFFSTKKKRIQPKRSKICSQKFQSDSSHTQSQNDLNHTTLISRMMYAVTVSEI